MKPLIINFQPFILHDFTLVNNVSKTITNDKRVCGDRITNNRIVERCFQNFCSGYMSFEGKKDKIGHIIFIMTFAGTC